MKYSIISLFFLLLSSSQNNLQFRRAFCLRFPAGSSTRTQYRLRLLTRRTRNIRAGPPCHWDSTRSSTRGTRRCSNWRHTLRQRLPVPYKRLEGQQWTCKRTISILNHSHEEYALYLYHDKKISSDVNYRNG